MQSVGNRIDQIIGRNVMAARMERGLSRSELAASIGVSETQISKYEAGASRLTANRLAQIAATLHVNATDFFGEIVAASAGNPANMSADAARRRIEKTNEALELVRAFQQITDSERRQRLVILAKQLAEDSAHAS